MHTLGLDLNDDSLMGTPSRVAKMFVKEIFSGLKPDLKPKSSTFENKYNYGEMLVEKNINLYSTCEHHLLPIVGKAHVAYISNGTVIGLSKINRIVEYYSKRPQVQERLTKQIVVELQKVLKTKDIACVIDAKHLCVNSRGIKDIDSSTVTSEFGGKPPGGRNCRKFNFLPPVAVGREDFGPALGCNSRDPTSFPCMLFCGSCSSTPTTSATKQHTGK
jgi:GTP cyclohydrolase I